MAAGLRSISPGDRLFRVGRAPDPWAWPDWSNAGPDGTFGNRYDDPQGLYRVLYAASDRLGAFVEVLARFRPDPHLLKELQEIDGDEEWALAPGHLDVSWLERRRLGEAAVKGRFADVGHSESLARLRRDLAGRIVHHGLVDLDAASIRLAAPRQFTQEVSRYVYEQTGPSGRRAFDGISYLSRLGDEFRNWALFEPPTEAEARRIAANTAVSSIAADDPDLGRALAIHGLVFVRST
jgi:hypothetical protein